MELFWNSRARPGSTITQPKLNPSLCVPNLHAEYHHNLPPSTRPIEAVLRKASQSKIISKFYNNFGDQVANIDQEGLHPPASTTSPARL